MKVKNDTISYENEEIEEIVASKITDRNESILLLERFIKRTVDFLGGIVGTILLVPITIAVFIGNKILKDNGPIFYTQERIGKNGKKFKMYKFRSMVLNADEKLEKYLSENEEARKEYKKYRKLKNDPRITKMGRLLRKTSLDEFPQFINIIKGDMSLVGPRPYLEIEKEEMNGFFKYITSMKPGLTGFWQVNGRNDVTFVDRLDMDMNYYYTRSLKLDAKILYKTVKKVIKREGAI